MGKITQDYTKKPVRTAAILTNAYVAGTVLDSKDYNQLIILADFTEGSLDDVQLKVEFSPDNSTFYQETFQAVSAGTATETVGVHLLPTTGKYRIPITIMDRYVKISAIGTGTVTASSLAIDALLGNN